MYIYIYMYVCVCVRACMSAYVCRHIYADMPAAAFNTPHACADFERLAESVNLSVGLTEVMRNLLRAHSALHRAPAMASPASGRRSLRARRQD